MNDVGGTSFSNWTFSWQEGNLQQSRRLLSLPVSPKAGLQELSGVYSGGLTSKSPFSAWQPLSLAENQSASLARLGCKIFDLNILRRRVLSYSEI